MQLGLDRWEHHTVVPDVHRRVQGTAHAHEVEQVLRAKLEALVVSSGKFIGEKGDSARHCWVQDVLDHETERHRWNHVGRCGCFDGLVPKGL